MTAVMVLLDGYGGRSNVYQDGSSVCGEYSGLRRGDGHIENRNAGFDSLARQPEAAGDVRSNMIVLTALIEGLAFFAIIVALVLFLVAESTCWRGSAGAR